MKRLLVVGDSFMHPDANFPGQHWSEMLPEYEIIMRSQSGSTNGMIAWQFFQGLELKPDAVVIGFTMADRIEFKNHNPKDSDKWYSSKHDSRTSADEKLAVDYYQATVCQEMLLFKGFLTVRSLLLTCEQQQIPYAFTLNGLWDVDKKDLTNEYWSTIHKHDTQLLGEFANHRATNFTTSGIFKTSPGFHVDDLAWQQRFAQEVREILQRPIDNSDKIL